mgnify:FL=1|jgi:sulfur carrier protein ThiS
MSELIKAMAEVNDLNRSHGVVQRGGKKYTEVFVRVEAFRKAFGTDHGINTDVVADDGKRVVIKAVITNSTGMIVGSGMAEEIRGQGNVNKTSALENAETSAIGRALASLGLHGGTYASLNEIDAVPRKAAAQQQARSTQPAPTPPPAPSADLVPLKTHKGKEVRQTEHQDFAVSLIKMFHVYANTTQDKDGNEVEPRKRMTLMRELKEHNADAIAAISEGLQDQVEKAYLKNIKSLGAQLKND